jgi:hypothetical protein
MGILATFKSFWWILAIVISAVLAWKKLFNMVEGVKRSMDVRDTRDWEAMKEAAVKAEAVHATEIASAVEAAKSQALNSAEHQAILNTVETIVTDMKEITRNLRL